MGMQISRKALYLSYWLHYFTKISHWYLILFSLIQVYESLKQDQTKYILLVIFNLHKTNVIFKIKTKKPHSVLYNPIDALIHMV